MANIAVRLARPILTFVSLTMLYSTAGAGWNAIAVGAVQNLLWPQGLRKAPEFSQAPTKLVIKSGTQRLPKLRGGVWTEKTLADDTILQRLRREKELMERPELLMASMTPTLSPFLVAYQEEDEQGGSEAGIPFPTEGSFGGEGIQSLAGSREAPLAHTWVVPATLKGGSSGGGGGSTGGSGGSSGGDGGLNQRNQLNPNTGNMVTHLPIVGWSGRGGNYVSFSLFHNSKHLPFSFQDVGRRWSHSYSMYVDYNSTLGTVALTTPDGMRWPFTRVGTTSTYNPPSGVHGQLIKTNPSTSSSAFKLRAPSQEEFYFNDDGHLIKIEDRDGNHVDINRNTSNNITSVDDNTGRSLTFDYVTNGTLQLIQKVTDPDGRVWWFDYNSSGQMYQVRYPYYNGGYPKDEFTYHSTGHQILTHKDRAGATWTYTYTAVTNALLDTATNPLGKVWDYSYGQSTASVTDPNSHSWMLSYTAGRVAASADASGFVEYYAADSAENLISLVDKRGKTWSWTYEHSHSDPTRRGNMLTATDPLSRTSTFAYNSEGDITSAQNALSQSATVTYSGSPSRPYQIKDPSNNVQATFTYNSFGEVTRVADATGVKYDSTYDSYGNVIQSDVVSASPESVLSTTATYDTLGRVLTSTDEAGETKTLEYDALGRLIKMYHEDSTYVQLFYDLENRVTSARNELGKYGYRTYNSAGYLTQTTNANSESQSYGYDNAGP